MTLSPRRFVYWFVMVLIAVSPAVAAHTTPRVTPPVITMTVDASEAPRKIFHATLNIPATPGTLTLYYPKWIPGEHGPTGPIQDLAGLKFTANGQSLKWRRDLLDGWTFHVEVPEGVSKIEASLDFISPAGDDNGIYTGGASATNKMTVLNWNTVLLYPAGWSTDELTYQATLRLPAGWKYGTPLPVASETGDQPNGQCQITFQSTSLTELVDSPVIAGEYLRVVPLAKKPPQEMDIAADSAAALEAPQEVLDHYKELTVQAQKLFGAQHFRNYHFLYSLSDHVAHFGLEHHESNDSRTGEDGLTNPESRLLDSSLLSHEYVHSWNGKFRRPVDLTTPDFEKPMQTDLLWVYEGLTTYLGEILSPRSGLRTPEQFRDVLASIAAEYDHIPGRTWRNLQDTADGVPSMQGSPQAWQSWRRSLDYYDEDVLNWLWADTIIRQQTEGKKSLDDFCHLFHGGSNKGPQVTTYTFDDVINTLGQVASYDWRGFWTERLTNHGPDAPLQGVGNSGWKLTYDDSRSELAAAWENEHKAIYAAYSIGLVLQNNGTVRDTIEGMAAAKAGIGPGMKVIAVNGRKFNEGIFRNALRAGKNSSEPLTLIVENTEYINTYTLDYHGGEKYPHLVREESKLDLLGDIIRPR